jgi:hypothetical protein
MGMDTAAAPDMGMDLDTAEVQDMGTVLDTGVAPDMDMGLDTGVGPDMGMDTGTGRTRRHGRLFTPDRGLGQVRVPFQFPYRCRCLSPSRPSNKALLPLSLTGDRLSLT